MQSASKCPFAGGFLKNTNQGTYTRDWWPNQLDLAPLKLAPGTYTVWFRGEEKAKRTVKGKETDATLVLCSNPVVLKLKDPAKP
jgi:catalase (peroxidase I)